MGVKNELWISRRPSMSARASCVELLVSSYAIGTGFIMSFGCECWM